MGPIISLDDWVPVRPPKNPLLRVPSPDLPPPPSPLHQQENDANTLNQNDPLPPPPAEFVRHMRQFSEPDTKHNVTSRRNSFAGSTSQKANFIKLTDFDNSAPPILPRKPIQNDVLGFRSASSMSKPMISYQATQLIHPSAQPLKAHKVIINGKFDANTPTSTPTQTPIGAVNNSRVSMRKRTHNAPLPVGGMQQQKLQANNSQLKPNLATSNGIENNNRSNGIRSSTR